MDHFPGEAYPVQVAHCHHDPCFDSEKAEEKKTGGKENLQDFSRVSCLARCPHFRFSIGRYNQGT